MSPGAPANCLRWIGRNGDAKQLRQIPPVVAETHRLRNDRCHAAGHRRRRPNDDNRNRGDGRRRNRCGAKLGALRQNADPLGISVFASAVAPQRAKASENHAAGRRIRGTPADAAPLRSSDYRTPGLRNGPSFVSARNQFNSDTGPEPDPSVRAYNSPVNGRKIKHARPIRWIAVTASLFVAALACVAGSLVESGVRCAARACATNPAPKHCARTRIRQSGAWQRRRESPSG